MADGAGPSDEALCSACSALLSGVDLATTTVRQARQLLSAKFGVDLEPRKALIKQQARHREKACACVGGGLSLPVCAPAQFDAVFSDTFEEGGRRVPAPVVADSSAGCRAGACARHDAV